MVYSSEFRQECGLWVGDARGRCVVFVESPHHIVSSQDIDYYKALKLQQLFTRREMQEPDIVFVSLGKNYAGLPKKTPDQRTMYNLTRGLEVLLEGSTKFLKYLIGGDGFLGALIESWERDGPHFMELVNADPKKGREMAALEIYNAHFDGKESYYDATSGKGSGATQMHPHSQGISSTFLPTQMEMEYERVEANAPFYSDLIKEGIFNIEKRENFVLLADPAPRHSGGLIIVAREFRNILEMEDGHLAELGDLMRLAQGLLDVKYGAIPSNYFHKQIFNGNFPSYRFNTRFDPKTSQWGFLERGFDVVGVSENPLDVARNMEELKDKYFSTQPASHSPS